MQHCFSANLIALIIILSTLNIFFLTQFPNYKKLQINRTQTHFLNTSLQWPPIKIFVYPNQSRHTSDCLYPPEMWNRYINETNYWFQRMLEPTIHRQFINSPILTSNPNSADLFLIPHYSRMCSGLDDGVRWKEIPSYLAATGNYFYRYSSIDHIIIHSVPHYGDKPADRAVIENKSPIIALLDFKYDEYCSHPWTFAKSMIIPFITLESNATQMNERDTRVFVAMATSKLKGSSARLRRQILQAIKTIKSKTIINIDRGRYKTFLRALNSLPNKMGRSDFCIVPPGDAPSSKRFYDSISHLCIPVLYADQFMLPYDGTAVDYQSMMIQIPKDNVNDSTEIITSFGDDALNDMRSHLGNAKERFRWNYKEAPKEGQALRTMVWALYDKHRMIQPYLNNEMTGYDADDSTFLQNVF